MAETATDDELVDRSGIVGDNSFDNRDDDRLARTGCNLCSKRTNERRKSVCLSRVKHQTMIAYTYIQRRRTAELHDRRPLTVT
jgi:hypothetical protein